MLKFDRHVEALCQRVNKKINAFARLRVDLDVVLYSRLSRLGQLFGLGNVNGLPSSTVARL